VNIRKKEGFLILAAIVLLVGSFDPGWTFQLGGRTVILWEHAGFSGRNMVWEVDTSLRHKLVPELPGWFDNKTSSIQVGGELNVALYRYPNYAGASSVYTVSGNMNSYWNDAVSSLVIFLKGRSQPQGVVISDTGFNAISGYERRTQFFPIPEQLRYHEANYPVLGDYINDRSQHVKIQGENIEVSIFKDTNFKGHYRIKLPSNECSPNATYRSGGFTCYRLTGCAMDLDGSVSSLKVRFLDK
jgi:hypothetical protein